MRTWAALAVFWYVGWGLALCDRPGWQFLTAATVTGIVLVLALEAHRA